MQNTDASDNIKKKEAAVGNEKSATLLKGATILMIAGIISKIFGAIFRIPLPGTLLSL